MAILQAIVASITVAAVCNAQTCLFDVPPLPGPTKDYSQNPTYVVGTLQQLTWRMDVDNAQLLFWQDNHPGDPIGGDHVILSESTNDEAFHWTVSYEGLDPSINNVFYFQVVASSDCTFTSHYFNLTGNDNSNTASLLPTIGTSASGLSTSITSTGSSSLSTSTPNPSTSGSPATVTSPIPTPSSSNTGAPSVSSTNVGLVAGLSVMASLFFITAVGVSAYFLRRRYLRRRAGQATARNGGQGKVTSQQGNGIVSVGNRQELGFGEIGELEVPESRYELDHQGRLVHHELQ